MIDGSALNPHTLHLHGECTRYNSKGAMSIEPASRCFCYRIGRELDEEHTLIYSVSRLPLEAFKAAVRSAHYPRSGVDLMVMRTASHAPTSSKRRARKILTLKSGDLLEPNVTYEVAPQPPPAS
jgi:hypothetical protein